MLKNSIEEPNSVKKGEKFELFFENLMAQEQGFLYISKHCRSRVGEIDYFYRNKLQGHPFWEKFPYLFIECKNWKEVISSEKMNHFIALLEAKTAFSCCGIYLTTSSFSPEGLTVMRDSMIKKGTFAIPITGNDLPEMVEKGFKTFVQEKCDKMLAKA